MRSILVEKYGEYVTSKLMEKDNMVYLDNNSTNNKISEQLEIVSLLNSYKELFEGEDISENIWNSEKEWGVDFSSWLGGSNDKEYMFIGAEPHINSDYQLVYDFGRRKDKSVEDSAEEFACGSDIWSYLTDIFVEDTKRSKDDVTSFLSKCYITDLCHIVPKGCGQIKTIKEELDIKTKDWNTFRRVIAERFLVDEIEAVNPKIIILHGNASRMFFKRYLGVEFNETSFIEGTKYRISCGEMNGKSKKTSYKIIAIPHLKGMMRNFIWRSNKYPERLKSAKVIINKMCIE